MPDPVPPDLVGALRGTAIAPFGEPLHYFTETGSTNDMAAALAEQGAPEGTTIVASAQSAGRGRLGRQWYSPPDAGLYVSVVCRNEQTAPFLTLAGGVAVAEGIVAATGLPVELKWPNDVVVADARGSNRRRKLAGVLAEAASDGCGLQYVVLGFGVNLRPAAYPSSIAYRATSLETELGRPVDAGLLLAAILESLAAHFKSLSNGDAKALLARCRQLTPSAVGAPVECERAGSTWRGVTAGIADDGALLVRTGGRTERVRAGEVVWK